MLEQRIEKYWDKRADSFNENVQKEMACRKKDTWESLLLQYAGAEKNLRVLDAGTGPGFFAILLAGLGYAVTAIDKCEDMLKQARKNAAATGMNIRFFKADAHAVDMAADSFDIITSRNVTWLLPNPLEVYQEWHRLLKPGGKVLLFDANWYLRLSDPELQLQYEACRQKAIEIGFVDKFTAAEKAEAEAIARSLPLTYEKRPLWDRQAFNQCGFQQIEVQENINHLVYDEIELVSYQPIPMFAICATK